MRLDYLSDENCDRILRQHGVVGDNENYCAVLFHRGA